MEPAPSKLYKPPAYVVFKIAVKDKDGCNNNFLKDAQKLIAELEAEGWHVSG